MNNFSSSSPDVKFYIVNKADQDILLSNDEAVVGSIVSESNDPIISGLNKVYASLDTTTSFDAEKVIVTDTDKGKMLYVASEIEGTSWIVVSAIPYSFISNNIVKVVTITFAVSLILILLFAFLLYLIIREYIDPVSRVTNKISELDNGDFTGTIIPEGNNEITTLSEQLNSYINRMRGMLLNLTSITTDMNRSAEECFQISNGLSSSNSSQNESIDRLNQILNTMNQSVDDVANAATQLADTASIEAARAGEMGKGFAVVAGEVGALASQSSVATENISQLIESITKNIEEINKKADNCISDMEKCLSGVSRTSASFDSIYEDITKAADGITDIADGINRISDVASNNAATTQEQAATIAQILKLSDVIVEESNKISGETGNLSEVSEKLNGYSNAITSDLNQFILGN